MDKKKRDAQEKLLAGTDGVAAARLTAIAALSALWSLFLWTQLVLLRSGGSTFCAAGGALDCSAIWNGAFAAAIQRLTGLPIAGWGLVWSAAAFAFPLIRLLRAAQGRPAVVLSSATRLTAMAGLFVVLGMIGASAAAGAFCIGCIGTYLLVALYAAIALRPLRRGLPEWKRAAVLSAGAAAGAFVLLLYPGLHTPRSSGEAGRRAVEAAPAPVDGSQSAGPAVSSPIRGTGNARQDQALSNFVASLEPALKQTLADSLAIYRASAPQPLPPPRALVGSDLAPVRITAFTDIRCEHCASLHETLRTLRDNVPPGSYSVDARQFPLDGRCNSLLRPGEGDDVRCVAAKLLICAGPAGKESDLASALFEKQAGLTGKQTREIAGQFLTGAQIASCLDSAGTRAELEKDIAAAARFDSDGTPIVAINGRKGTSFAPFLYSMVLTRGNASHPAFDGLPPGNPTAHLH